jgi:hypothetical protein
VVAQAIVRAGQVLGTTRCGKRRTKRPKLNLKRGCVQGCVRIHRKSFARGEGAQRSEFHSRVELVMKLSSNGAALVMALFVAWLLAYCQASFATCDVYCTSLGCWKSCDGTGTIYQVDDSGLVHSWFHSTAGCTRTGCACSGTSAAYTVHVCSATVQCPALCTGNVTNNAGQATACNTPTGDALGPYTSCAGCTPLPSQ